MKPSLTSALVLASLSSALAAPAVAQATSGQSTLFSSFGGDFSGEAGFTAAGDAKVHGAKFGEVETTRYRFTGGVETPVTDAWKLKVGVLFDHTGVDADTTLVPLSDRYEAIAAVLGASWAINDAWTAKIELRPGFYGDAEVDAGDAFTVPAIIAARWQFRPDLSFTVGASVQPFVDSVVMPVVGVRWQIDDRWTLLAGAPRTELSYALNEATTLFGGLSLGGGAYAVDDPTVTAPPGKNLRDTKIEVSEMRSVLGLRREFGGGLFVSIEGGYAFERKFDYYERGVEVDVGGAMFGAITIGGSF